MDLRTKLVFALVSAALGSMLALGWMSYGLAGELLEESAHRRLDAVVESKGEELKRAIVGWEDRARLIANRTQLRGSLAAHLASGDRVELQRMGQILEDAVAAVGTLQSAVVYDTTGAPVSWTVSDEPAGAEPEHLPRSADSIVFADLWGAAGGQPRIRFFAPMEQSGDVIGAVGVTFSAEELLRISADTTGLGTTGEIIIARGLDATTGVIVNELRLARNTPFADQFERTRQDDVFALALAGEDSPAGPATDYRGESVWASARYVPALDVGVVVKMDVAEQVAPISELRRELLRVGLALAGICVVIGTLLGFWFSKPVHDLADVANRIRQGDLDARADASAEDEIGSLAATFNLMAEELITSNRALERRIGEVTGKFKKAPPRDED